MDICFTYPNTHHYFFTIPIIHNHHFHLQSCHPGQPWSSISRIKVVYNCICFLITYGYMWFQPSSDNPLARLQAANGQVLGIMSVRKKRNSGASPPTVRWTHNIHIKWSCASMQIWAWSHLQSYLRTCHEQSYKITFKSNLYNNYLIATCDGKKVGESLPIRKKFSACGSLCILRTEDKDPVLNLWQRPVG